MSEPRLLHPAAASYARTIHARWGDMDFNGHMRNTAYLDAAGNVRVQYFADHGFTAGEFERRQIGPVILRDGLEYYRELHLLEEVVVRLELIGLSEDGSHFRIRNDFQRADGQKIARVKSTGGWLDLRSRRLTEPPSELGAVLRGMPRSARRAAASARHAGHPSLLRTSQPAARAGAVCAAHCASSGSALAACGGWRRGGR